jgi:hypothetical protein
VYLLETNFLQFLLICTPPQTTIAEFKAKISNLTNVAPTVQRLIFQGKVLKDDQTVGSYCTCLVLFGVRQGRV